jgi:hypothetical protein
LLILTFVLAGCREEINEEKTPRNIFESLWKLLDEKYCFFEEKEVDWDRVHDKYASRMDTTSNSISLFKTLGEMICELRDGHVNLYAAQDVARYWKWFEDYAPNFNKEIEKKYLGKDYKISSGLKYKLLKDNVGYVTYRDFSTSINDAGLDYILTSFENCRGIILDVRDNSGGNLSNVEKLASRFTEKKFISAYIQHKNGPGHNDFSKPFPIYVNPSSRTRYSKPVVVLTNRTCYSATNAFVSTMRQLPNVTIMGDRTGGGSGFPMNSILPNGWIVRFSSCPTYNSDMELTESGIDPDIAVSMKDEDILKGLDTILEKARSFLRE